MTDEQLRERIGQILREDERSLPYRTITKIIEAGRSAGREVTDEPLRENVAEWLYEQTDRHLHPNRPFVDNHAHERAPFYGAADELIGLVRSAVSAAFRNEALDSQSPAEQESKR